MLRWNFLSWAKHATSPTNRTMIGEAVLLGNFEKAMVVADRFVEHFAHSLGSAFISAAEQEADAWVRRLHRTQKAGGSLDLTDKQIISAIQRNKFNTVQNLTAQQRGMLRTSLIKGVRRGEGADRIGARFKASLGLTNKQQDQVDNYQRLLEQTSQEALSYKLRDPRFDGVIQRAVDANDMLSADQIENMVGAYADNLRQSRAEAIAKTESLKIVNQARNMAFAQIAKRADIVGRKRWLHTAAAHPREDHLTMVGTEVGMDEAFELPSGASMMYPGDASLGAGPDDIINCQCGIEYITDEGN
jgi:hypothetical protein